MKLTLLRNPSSEYSTIGRLDIDGVWEAWTLEDCVRDHKIYGRTAIPPGTYEIKLTYSPRFEKVLPELLNVPEFIGIRIHPGNTHEDTHGCILVGKKRGQDVVLESRRAFAELMPKLEAAKAKGEKIEIQILPATPQEEWSV